MSAERKLRELPLELKSHKELQAEDYQPSNQNKRVVAFLFDALVSGILIKVMTSLLTPISAFFGPLMAQFMISTAYWILPTYAAGQTLGKKLFNLYVIDNRNRPDLSLAQVAFRETVGRFLSAVPLGLGYIWILFRDDRRTWHDLMAKTRVVHK